MFGRLGPILGCQPAQSDDEFPAQDAVTSQRILKIDVQQRIFRVISTRIIRLNDRLFLRQHDVESPLE